MADRVYLSARPNPHPPPPSSTTGRPIFRRPPPQTKPLPQRRRRRRYCCACCLWFTFILFALILVAAIAGGVFYFLYRPRGPSFSLSSLRLSALNITATNDLSSRIDLAVIARNPNRKLVFLYDPTTISASFSGVDVGDGAFPAFVHDAGNTTVLKTTLVSSGKSLDPSIASDLKKQSSLPLEIDLETKAAVKIGSLKTMKIGIRIACSGINVTAPPKGGGGGGGVVNPATKARCKAQIRIKIWKWTV